jgi:hypothetical protein
MTEDDVCDERPAFFLCGTTTFAIMASESRVLCLGITNDLSAASVGAQWQHQPRRNPLAFV